MYKSEEIGILVGSDPKIKERIQASNFLLKYKEYISEELIQAQIKHNLVIRYESKNITYVFVNTKSPIDTTNKKFFDIKDLCNIRHPEIRKLTRKNHVNDAISFVSKLKTNIELKNETKMTSTPSASKVDKILEGKISITKAPTKECSENIDTVSKINCSNILRKTATIKDMYMGIIADIKGLYDLKDKNTIMTILGEFEDINNDMKEILEWYNKNIVPKIEQ